MNRILTIFVLSLAAFPACRSQPPPAEAKNPHARAEVSQWSGQHSGRDAAATEVLRSTDEWNAFWSKIEQPRPRPLDAAREMAVVIFLGGKRTGGFSAEFIGTRVQDGKYVVEYRETAPEPGTMVTQELTTPWTLAVVPKSDLPVEFRRAGQERPSRQTK